MQELKSQSRKSCAGVENFAKLAMTLTAR